MAALSLQDMFDDAARYQGRGTRFGAHIPRARDEDYGFGIMEITACYQKRLADLRTHFTAQAAPDVRMARLHISMLQDNYDVARKMLENALMRI